MFTGSEKITKRLINKSRAKSLEYERKQLPKIEIPLSKDTCTCGSGAHPRKCKKHPYGWDIHVAYLNLYSEMLRPNPNLHEDYNKYVIELIDAYTRAIKAKYKKPRK